MYIHIIKKYSIFFILFTYNLVSDLPIWEAMRLHQTLSSLIDVTFDCFNYSFKHLLGASISLCCSSTPPTDIFYFLPYYWQLTIPRCHLKISQPPKFHGHQPSQTPACTHRILPFSCMFTRWHTRVRHSTTCTVVPTNLPCLYFHLPIRPFYFSPTTTKSYHTK